jgi:hypothetical protein
MNVFILVACAFAIAGFIAIIGWVAHGIHRHYPVGEPHINRERTRRYIDLILATGQLLAAFGTCAALVFAGLQLSQSGKQFFQDLAAKAISEFNQRVGDTIQHLGNEDAIVREGALLRLRFLFEHARTSRQTGGAAAAGLISDADIKLLLVGYIRTHATNSHFEETMQKKQLWPPPDVLTAISLLSDVSRGQPERGNQDGRSKLLDLSGICLAQADLTEVDMSYWKLDNADFHDSKLDYCNFTGASLMHAILKNVSLRNANLISTNLEGADLRKSNFANVKLDKTILSGANFTDSTDIPAEPFRRSRVLIDTATLLPPYVISPEEKATSTLP